MPHLLAMSYHISCCQGPSAPRDCKKGWLDPDQVVYQLQYIASMAWATCTVQVNKAVEDRVPFVRILRPKYGKVAFMVSAALADQHLLI